MSAPPGERVLTPSLAGLVEAHRGSQGAAERGFASELHWSRTRCPPREAEVPRGWAPSPPPSARRQLRGKRVPRKPESWRRCGVKSPVDSVSGGLRSTRTRGAGRGWVRSVCQMRITGTFHFRCPGDSVTGDVHLRGDVPNFPPLATSQGVSDAGRSSSYSGPTVPRHAGRPTCPTWKPAQQPNSR